MLEELKFYSEDWHNYLRMDEVTYLNLLAMVSPLIERKDTRTRQATSPHERLTSTLRFLAIGRN
jgi:hypothetical protein